MKNSTLFFCLEIFYGRMVFGTHKKFTNLEERVSEEAAGSARLLLEGGVDFHQFLNGYDSCTA